MEDRGRESYSSYSSFSSPHMKPAPVGSRGRGTPAYPESGFGSRNYDAFGGPFHWQVLFTLKIACMF